VKFTQVSAVTEFAILD